MSDPVDLLLRGRVVNVATGTVEEGAVAIDDGEIVALAERPAERVVEGAYVAPGLVDAHTHVEASMVTLPRYGEALVPKGVTGAVYDPHEVANVLGASGVRAFAAGSEHTPLKARLTVPSSVPASDLQDTGAELDPEAVASILDTEDAIALGEVMNTHGLLAGEDDIHAKIRAARERGLPVDGHAPGVSGADLSEVARFLDNDHESVAHDEAREKVEAGLRVYLREGSASKNLTALAGLVEDVNDRRLALCTDGTNVAYTDREGGVNVAVRKAISLGVDPVTAVRMASLNVAEAYGLPFGRLEPGAPADAVVLSDLESWRVEHVVVDGELDPTKDRPEPPVSELPTDTVEFDPVEPSDLATGYDGEGPVRVRVASAVGDFQTERLSREVPVVHVGGEPALGADHDDDVLPMAVIERHGGDGNIGTGFAHNLGIERGAIGTTVAHDAHNCLVVGADHDAMAKVANHLRDVGGGFAVYDPDGGFTTLELPLAGLMSDAPLDTVVSDFEAVREAAERIGLSVPGGLLELTFLPLEVIPTYRLTNNGLVDVETMEFVDVIE